MKTVEQLTQEALKAAVNFIESHAADPDITDEMIENYRKYTDALTALERVKGMSLAEFFYRYRVSKVWYTSTANPTGVYVNRESDDDDEVFETITSNPDFWELEGMIDGYSWECIDTSNCFDYRGNSITKIVAFI